MKKYNFLLAILAFATVFFTVSCEDYLDKNTDPNGPSLDALTPDIVLPGAMTRPSEVLMTRMNQLGNTMIATWSGNSQQIQSPFNEEFTYLINADFYDEIWNRVYVRTNNLTHIINFENGENYDYHKAVAKILKSFYFQYLVDIYGDIPYTEAHLRGENLFPNYDDQADVYRDLVTQINEAIDLIDNVDTTTVIALGSNDIMLNGDLNMWKKFANTIKLRLLVRLMNKATLDATTETFIQDEFISLNAAGVSFLGLNENVTIDPGYSDEAQRMNPFAEDYGYNPGGFGDTSEATTGNTLVGPTQFLVEFLDGTTTGAVDNRLSRLYTLRGGQTVIEGNTQGGGVLPSKLGLGLLSSPTQVGYIMTAAESLFLQSEAVERGYLTNGSNAKSLFQDGIRSSFNMLGATGADAYITANDLTNLIGWDGTANKIEAIITQKWIALGGTNGLETWIEYNRTRFPSNMPFPDNAPQQIIRPRRILYPTSEYSGNTTNVSVYNQTSDSAFDTSIFWDIN